MTSKLQTDGVRGGVRMTFKLMEEGEVCAGPKVQTRRRRRGPKIPKLMPTSFMDGPLPRSLGRPIGFGSGMTGRWIDVTAGLAPTASTATATASTASSFPAHLTFHLSDCSAALLSNSIGGDHRSSPSPLSLRGHSQGTSVVRGRGGVANF